MAGLHRFNEMKTKNSDGPQSPESILLLCDADPGPVLRETAALAQSEVAGIVLARDLTISPANRATPGFIAETASEIAAKFGFQIEIIDLDSARSMGMGAFDAVAKAAPNPLMSSYWSMRRPGPKTILRLFSSARASPSTREAFRSNPEISWKK